MNGYFSLFYTHTFSLRNNIEAMLCCTTLKWILDYKDRHRWQKARPA